MTRTLRISLLGDVSIQLGGDLVTGLPSRAAEALLIYLVCSPRPVAREKLAELLWAERSPTQALTNLRTILTPLRRELGDYLVVTRQTLAFDHSRAHWLDVTDFEQGSAALELARMTSLDPERARHLQTTLDLYQGDFLEGFYLKDGQGFEEWVTLQRERLRQLAREGFRWLANYQLDTAAYLPGLATAARWRQLDPYSEQACRTHMWLLTRSGQPHLALQAYQEMQQLLEADLGVAPSASTTALFEQLRAREFPPPPELPPPAAIFVGRESEVADLGDLLVARDSRLLTLAGPGGIGKTRLAVEAARSMAHRWPGRFLDGVYFVPLASVRSAQSLPTQIADALRLSWQGSEPLRNQLLSHLELRELLLILDNVEHLIDEQGYAITLFIDMLQRAPGVKLLLTSRERLSLYEEVIFDVQGLAVAREEDEAPTRASAVQLFLEAGRRVRRDYTPGAEEITSIVQVCRLVAGVPLAIELAASWLRHYDSSEIMRQIQHSLDFLASDYRDLPERQRSLRSVFEYSWRLLTTEEQSALAQLAVFSGGFAPDAVQAVLGRPAPLIDLADKSLLQHRPGARFDLHPLLRHYAAEKLGLDPVAQVDATDRHRSFYLDYVCSRSSGDSPEQRAAIRLELANIRCAWEWAAQRGAWEALGCAAATLHSFYSVQSWFQEGIDLFAQTLATLEAAGDTGPTPAALRVELLGRKARMHIHIGSLAEARADLDRALADLDYIDDRARRSVLDSLAITHYYAGDYAQAAALARDSLRLAEQDGDQKGAAFALNFMGSCAKALGDYEQARVCFQRSSEAYLLLPDEMGAAMVFNNLGNLLQSLDDWSGAQRYYRQSSELFKKHDHDHGAATTLANAGKLAGKQGAYDIARQLLAESLDLKRTIGDGRGEAVALAGLGDVALAVGAYTEARTTLLQALELAHQAGDIKQVLEVLAPFAELLHRQNQRVAAVQLLAFLLNHRGLSQEARQRVEAFARDIEHDRAAAQDLPLKNENEVLSFLRSLG